MEDDRNLLDRARAGARELVHVAREGDTDGVFEALRRLTGHQGVVGPDTRLIVGQLVSASAQMMLLRVGSPPPDVTYAVDLRDDDEFAVPIDELEPPLRATVRALLAELNGRPEEADFQLDLALRERTVPTTLDVVVHSLLWTIGLLEWCEAERQPAPEWLSAGWSCN
ncbi:hypothetical protein KIPE111705_00375 [Kibdelosporangium persicum]|uniref:Uncharacterized protein n=1 Tax=Kibdelosporangium persicum TaxID=2698649 RepID=A0ABX2F8P7_9PSEU|nr:hypothetical protein [Kibdelosporangium persicum]NRN67627.1 hypothetical protein [Kibdelosporangium persicum]